MKTKHRKAAHAKRLRVVSLTSWAETIIGNRQQDHDHAEKVVYAVRRSLECLKSGTTDNAHFDRVGGALNIALVRSESIDELCVVVMLAGIKALERCDGIHARHDHYGFFGPDIQVVTDAVDLYAEILRKSTPLMMEAATLEADRRMLEQVHDERLAA
jgi:hypothetical protein